MTTDNTILERVAKLLAKAADPACTEPEREAFQSKAFQMMAEHRITEAQVAGAAPAINDPLGTYPLGAYDGVYGRVRVQLVGAIARAFDVEIFWRGYGNQRNLFGYGFKSDIDRVTALSNRLLADADFRASALTIDPDSVSMFNPDDGSWYKSTKGAIQAATIRERRGFFLGYADAVGSRLRTATAAATAAHRERTNEATAESTALVLVDRKRQVREGYRQAHPNLSTAGGLASAGNGSGRSSGYAAGSRADLSTQNSVRNQRSIGR